MWMQPDLTFAQPPMDTRLCHWLMAHHSFLCSVQEIGCSWLLAVTSRPHGHGRGRQGFHSTGAGYTSNVGETATKRERARWVRLLKEERPISLSIRQARPVVNDAPGQHV